MTRRTPPTIAICRWCARNMAHENTISCDETKMVDYPDGLSLPAIPYHVTALQPYVDLAPPRCRDCNVAWEGMHHLHCCVERCPRCHNQLISCGCFHTP